MPRMGYTFAKIASETPFPHEDSLFVDIASHTWGPRYEISICAWYVNKYQEGLKECKYILSLENISNDVREITKRNMELYENKIKENDRKTTVVTLNNKKKKKKGKRL